MSRLQVPVTEQDHIQGDPNAETTLVEYGDYQCPHCRAADVVVKKLQRHFGERLRFVYRNFPLTEIHEMAEPAAEAAEFAGAKGKFWEMHDAIFKNQQSLDVSMLLELAEGLGLKGEEAGAAVENQEFADKIGNDVNGALQAGVHGTPTFFINGEQYAGAWDYEPLAEAIEQD